MNHNEEKFYKLNALSSITAYEVVQILQVMELEISQSVLEKLPKDIRRHFQESKDEDRKGK